jgi:hypothetical protein
MSKSISGDEGSSSAFPALFDAAALLEAAALLLAVASVLLALLFPLPLLPLLLLHAVNEAANIKVESIITVFFTFTLVPPNLVYREKCSAYISDQQPAFK